MTAWRWSVAIALAVLPGPSPAAAQWLELDIPPRPVVDSAAVAAGREIYQARCAACHGEQGDGRGPVARYLWPRPRDLSSANYALRTTATGELPTDEDLFRTITLGMAGTSMPAWGATLSDRQRWQVVFYIKTFAADLFENPALDPDQFVLTIGKPPSGDGASLTVGRRAFEDAKCWECHGQAGRGDGGKGADLRDERGFPSRPVDMELKWKYKGGKTVGDFYLRLSTGLDGTPMPSYLKTLTEEQRWALARYSISLPDRSAPERATTVLVARASAGPLPSDPDDPAWNAADEFNIPLSGQATFAPRWQIPSVTDLAVRALFQEGEIAFRLAWNDPVADTLAGDSALAAAEGWTADDTYPVIFPDGVTTRPRYHDAAEVMLPANADAAATLPHFVYGDPGNPVDLWRWRASHGGGGIELRGTGPQRAPAPLPSEQQQVAAQARWKEGRWSVVVRRPLEGRSRLLPVAFHVWDGSNGETGLRMALSSWYFLRLGPAVAAETWLSLPLIILLALGAEWWLVRWVRRRVHRGELREFGIEPWTETVPEDDWFTPLQDRDVAPPGPSSP